MDGRQEHRHLRAVPRPGATRHKAEAQELRGRQKLALIRDLAMKEWDTPSLATMYGMTRSEVIGFMALHAQEIAEVSAALAGTLDISTAGMWVTKRQARLAEYQSQIEDIDKVIQRLSEQGIDWSRAHRDMYRARLDLYRAVADELGAYPQRAAAPPRQGQGVIYSIEADDREAMT